ncbi:insulin-like growth factor 2 mRNA-binding protein 2, partial [Pollicipes pollicipes]|uniref:insulin-like growth factor 2 mRNA-binding protein 2 n=1 Tax=Pollicipes pollicipes TaxID=41117 RepID=UPI001884D493
MQMTQKFQHQMIVVQGWPANQCCCFSEVPLKILAHNNLIGRIIGKGGNVIKGIMEETDTRITVSRATDVNSFNLDRTITIKGCPEGICEAERMVMARLRQSYENDMHSAAPHVPLYADVGRLMAGPAGGYGRGEPGLYGAGPAGYGPMYPSPAGMPALHGQPETVYVYVPSAAVGAIIGRKGSHIRSMIRFSAASVKIGQQEEEPLGGGGGAGGGGGGGGAGGGDGGGAGGDGSGGAGGDSSGSAGGAGGSGDSVGGIGDSAAGSGGGSGDSAGGGGDSGGGGAEEDEGTAESAGSAEPPPPTERPAERKVAIYGTPEAQWKAQYMIFDKLREEGYGTGLDDVRLSIEIAVPSSQVGRIIGKKGQNVRELQRTTGTVIKLPQPPEDGVAPTETAVHMIGPFISVQSAQRRIRALVAQGAPPVPRPPR